MRRNNDRMLLESLVRKYGANSIRNAVNRINENTNINFDKITKYGISYEDLIYEFDGIANVRIQKRILKDIEKFLNKPVDELLVYINFSDSRENENAFYELNNLYSDFYESKYYGNTEVEFRNENNLKSVHVLRNYDYEYIFI